MRDSNKKYIKIIWVLLVGMIILQFAYLFIEYKNTKSYKSVEATLLRIVKVSDSSVPDENMSYNKVGEYEFLVNGEKITASKNELWLNFKKEKNKYMIKYNPSNPTELENTYGKYTSIIVLIVCLLGILVLLFGKSPNSSKENILCEKKR